MFSQARGGMRRAVMAGDIAYHVRLSIAPILGDFVLSSIFGIQLLLLFVCNRDNPDNPCYCKACICGKSKLQRKRQ